MLKDRSTYKDLINRIETNFSVNEWMHNGYHIWPVLRIYLFMKLVKQNEDSRDSQYYAYKKEYGFFSKFFKALSTGIDFSLSKRGVSKLYCGSPDYRVAYLGKQFNRYFDPLLDKDNDQNNLLLESRTDSKNNYYKPERVFLLSDLFRYFRLFKKNFWNIPDDNNYANKLNDILNTFDIELKNFVLDSSRFVSGVDRNLYVFDKFLKKYNPSEIYTLCYYSNPMLGLNIAADRLGIPTIDMQHGPQGDHHLAYGSWTNVPESGYEALPNKFNTWDESSALSINNWADTTVKHSSSVQGNPWVEGWKKGMFKSTNFEWPDNLILYTLQPTGNSLEPYLLETIKKTLNHWNWWLRLHPRQMGELDDLKQKLRDFEILNCINITDATELPLPEILTHTNVHITKFSGCAVEASEFSIPTVILDQRGEKIFKDYLEADNMISYKGQVSDELISRIRSFLVSSKNQY